MGGGEGRGGQGDGGGEGRDNAAYARIQHPRGEGTHTRRGVLLPPCTHSRANHDLYSAFAHGRDNRTKSSICSSQTRVPGTSAAPSELVAAAIPIQGAAGGGVPIIGLLLPHDQVSKEREFERRRGGSGLLTSGTSTIQPAPRALPLPVEIVASGRPGRRYRLVIASSPSTASAFSTDDRQPSRGVET